ncbi:cell division inhibitor SidA [Phenylobacterium sp.]
MREMVRLARESLAFASVASFVWMMCTVAGAVS